MSDILNITDNASLIVSKLNDNFSDNPGLLLLSINDNALVFIQKLNSNFSNINSTFPYNTILPVDIGTLELGEDIGGMTIDDFIRYGINNENRSLKFLHISDTHNFAGGINQCKTLQDNDTDISFTILTGDYSSLSGSYSSINTALTSLGSKLLMVNGNHDTWDAFSKNQLNATSFLKSKVINEDVEWGDSSNIASYWYRDITINNDQILRIIGLDSYEYYNKTSAISQYDTIYTLKQVDWFIDKITELSDKDYLIIAMHEPPVNATTSDYAYNVSGKMDANIVNKRRLNDFCSSRLWVWDTSLTNGNLFPTIMDAYLNRGLLHTTINNTNTDTGRIVSSITLEEDFRNIVPCKFLFYIAGHLHGDMIEYHPDFEDLLILLIDNSNTSSLGKSSDLGNRSTDTSDATRSTGIIINLVHIDFALKKIYINRVGELSAGSYNGFNSVTRDDITLNF